MFFVDYEASYSTTINAPVQTVVDFLHDPAGLMRLNPVIIDVKNDPNDSQKYIIVDQLNMLGFKRQLTYTSKVTITEAGMEAESSAGAGTTTIARFIAKSAGTAITELEERTSVNVRLP
ncbi:SWIM-type domain-containing protein [Mycena indigotica]|uniref:SWIM-type domain-containing protein n=1 Tax=Mycena indigotica TaxID=2126181 RepID=A0A8H6S2U0_9AGAR|nr:SWIM-type domain-containing protein [Mycena indigotica]KAF7290817.1 SWIM-type domain-containing protein [Mycena indigotica]